METTPDYYALFRQVLDAPYTQLRKETASYSFRLSRGTLEIFFEWSRGAVDWKNNLDFPARPYRDMADRWYAHRGFLRVWKTLEPVLSPWILHPQVQSIRIAGYSHGAALALLCHEYCMFYRQELAEAESISGVGFGCPRVLFGAVSPRVAERFRNFTVIRNCRDLVTHLPPALLGYRHVGTLLQIGSGAPMSAVDCHRPENYLAALRQWREEQESVSLFQRGAENPSARRNAMALPIGSAGESSPSAASTRTDE